ncbi:MAG TPA: serpin family protein [Mucilaginibacter sp.]|jgi:serpin B
MKLIYKTLLLLSLVTIGLASCKKGEKVNPNRGKNLVLTPLDQLKVTADNSFTIKLFKNLDSTNINHVNLFVSPLSVSFALGMTSNGASGQTLTAFQNTLNFAGLTQTQVNDYYNNLITNLPQLDPNTKLSIANSIWYKQDFSVLPQFLQTSNTYFHAKIQALDFSNPASINTINNWVSDNTNGKIPSVISKIPPDAIMYLINAIYFKSTWKEKFDPKATFSMPFYRTDNSQVQTSFMTGEVNFSAYYDSNVSVFELPYSNDKYSMVIALPAYSSSLSQMVTGLTSDQWQTWMSGLKPDKATLTLPKFKFSYGVLLNNALIDLGLGNAFSSSANFSLINPTAPLAISRVTHNAYVETDENGTTAAAVSTVAMATTARAPIPPINRPFMFVIREVSSGLILFTGTVNDPTQAGG